MTKEMAARAMIQALQVAFENSAIDVRSARVVHQAFMGAQTKPLGVLGTHLPLPACSYLELALATAAREQGLWKICESFREIANDLNWYRSRMQSYPQTASPNFMAGHANATLIGPDGLIVSEKLSVGVSILAPDVRHPDHYHAPSEVYLVVSEGEFRQGEDDWFAPGYGGTLFNQSNIIHAMRSGAKPLLAFWVLGQGI